jgi:hypothetical protein
LYQSPTPPTSATGIFDDTTAEWRQLGGLESRRIAILEDILAPIRMD